MIAGAVNRFLRSRTGLGVVAAVLVVVAGLVVWKVEIAKKTDNLRFTNFSVTIPSGWAIQPSEFTVNPNGVLVSPDRTVEVGAIPAQTPCGLNATGSPYPSPPASLTAIDPQAATECEGFVVADGHGHTFEVAMGPALQTDNPSPWAAFVADVTRYQGDIQAIFNSAS